MVYTNDDKGSYDPEMSSQHLARIRRAEQEVSEGELGTPKYMWMGYDDGMLGICAAAEADRGSNRHYSPHTARCTIER